MAPPGRDGIPVSALALGLAGVVPFWLPVAATVTSMPGLPAARAVAAQVVYGALILSFLGGVRWGAAIERKAGAARDLVLALAVLGCLAGFAAVLLPAVPGLSLILAGLLLHAGWDAAAAARGELPDWFARLRLLLTALVVPAVVATLVSSLGAG